MKSNIVETRLFTLGTCIFLVILPPIFYIWLPYKIITSDFHFYAFEIGALRYAGIVPILLGIMAILWCAWDLTFSGKGTPWPMIPPQKLVVKGLYRFVRNPMYIGGMIILIGEALLFESTNLFLYALVMFILFNLLIYVEEAALMRIFGESYEQYCKSVCKWIPRLTPFRRDNSKSF